MAWFELLGSPVAAAGTSKMFWIRNLPELWPDDEVGRNDSLIYLLSLNLNYYRSFTTRPGVSGSLGVYWHGIVLPEAQTGE